MTTPAPIDLGAIRARLDAWALIYGNGDVQADDYRERAIEASADVAALVGEVERLRDRVEQYRHGKILVEAKIDQILRIMGIDPKAIEAELARRDARGARLALDGGTSEGGENDPS